MQIFEGVRPFALEVFQYFCFEFLNRRRVIAGRFSFFYFPPIVSNEPFPLVRVDFIAVEKVNNQPPVGLRKGEKAKTVFLFSVKELVIISKVQTRELGSQEASKKQILSAFYPAMNDKFGVDFIGPPGFFNL
ncbi:MAG: hypothetical protein IPH12_17075 [Saprospirales bacterium]|nr:hypothetical protein [Saprospirales bacterium]